MPRKTSVQKVKIKYGDQQRTHVESWSRKPIQVSKTFQFSYTNTRMNSFYMKGVLTFMKKSNSLQYATQSEKDCVNDMNQTYFIALMKPDFQFYI